MSNLFLVGNGKRHHDPPLCLKRLLCFGEGAWRELRGVVGRKVRGRAAARAEREERPRVDVAAELEEGDRLDLPPSDLRLGIAVLNWWEVPRWHEMADECSVWGDPRPETLRALRELRRGKQMDT